MNPLLSADAPHAASPLSPELVSIGVSVYGQPIAWLQECIRSALMQSWTRLELLVRPDGPEALDGDSLAWLQQQARLDPRLRLLRGERNLGTFGSLAAIFRQARGAYLVQLDADDRLHPRALELACQELQNDVSRSMVYSRCLEMTADGRPLAEGVRQQVPYDDQDMLVQFITFHMRCIRRKSYEQVGGYRSVLRYTGDYDLSLRLSEVGSVGFLPHILYEYRLHSSNTSRQQYQATVNEAFQVARDALYRRELAGRFHLRLQPDNTVKLLRFGSWARPPLATPGGNIRLDPAATAWL